MTRRRRKPGYAPTMAALVVGLLTPEQLRELVRRALAR